MRGWLVLLFFAPSFAFAAAAERSVSAGVSFSHFDYNEDLPSPQQSHESGWIPLLDLDARIGFASQWEVMGALQATYKAQTQFEGSTNATGTYASEADDQTILRGETSLGFYPVEIVRLFGGLALSRWERLLNYGTGYRETYAWTAAVLGIGVQVARQEAWDLWIEAAVLPTLNATLDVNFSDYIAGGDNATLALGNRVGSRIRVTWRNQFRNGLALTLAPFFERYEFGGTDTVANTTPLLGGSIREPSSRTEQYGAAAALALSF